MTSGAGPYTDIHSKEHLEMTARAQGSPTQSQNAWQGDEIYDMVRNAVLELCICSLDELDTNTSQYQGQRESTQPTKDTYAKRGALAKNKSVKLAIAAFVGLLVILAVVLALVFTVGKKNKGSTSSTGGSSSPTAGVGPNGGLGNSGTSGKSGSLVTMEDGQTFTYVNNFGGEWVADPKRPFARGGKAQEWSPRIGTEEWRWGTDIIRGVNLGYVHLFLC